VFLRKRALIFNIRMTGNKERSKRSARGESPRTEKDLVCETDL